MDILSPTFVLVTITAAFILNFIALKYRVLYLVLLSSVFLSLIDLKLLVYVLAYSGINFYWGKRIAQDRKNATFYRIAIAFNLLQLVLLHYADFIIDPVFEWFNSSVRVSLLSELLVPIGISYFTLQGIGYIINVKMGWEKPEKRFDHFFLYISFFPKFLAGPIERSKHFLPQLKGKMQFTESNFINGLRLILYGLFKKIAIANELAPYVMDSFRNVEEFNGASLLVMTLILPLYLYFDFSAYTDMAIGLARCFNIELLDNFKRPFFSENMTVFWRRFHITLGSWFNEYVFRQFSFKFRKWGTYATVYGVFITWILFGVWHGAGWNFFALGVLQAVAIYYEFFTKKWRYRIYSHWPNSLRIWFGRVVTYLFYSVSLVFFFAPNLKYAFDYLAKLLSFSGELPLDALSTKPIFLLIYVPVIFLLELLENDYPDYNAKLRNVWYAKTKKSRILRWGIYSTLITIMFIQGLKSEQFVYANF
ncbi:MULTISPECIES: MBOAT family O-acyltransferase [unclassified Carboxylicivirga]|uniref:MBOAT family O-acyltransferase n=1 Tax=Carboxylicivirga TaxID=1628153 RepID=UPI003D332071